MTSASSRTFWRRLTGSLGGRLGLAFVGIVVIGLLAVAAAWRYFSLAGFEQNSAALLAGQIRAVRLVADEIGEDLPRLQAAFARAGLPVLIDARPPGVFGSRPRFEHGIARRASEELGEEVKLTIRLIAPRSAYLSFRWREHDMLLSVPLSRWDRGLPPPLPSFLIVIVLACAALGLLAVLWLQRPLRQLADGIAARPSGPQPIAAARFAPDEVLAVTQAYNRMVADLAAREREREQILGGVSHDLKAPLARLRMRATLVDDPQLAEGIVRDVASLDRIAEQFLGFVRSGVEEVPGARCELGPLLRDMATRHAGEPLETEIEAGLPAARCSPHSAERIVSNLLSNAFEYGQPPVCLRLAREGDRLCLSVSDKGAGIPAAQFPRATEAFVRLDPSRGLPGHCGLGLAIVARLARGAGGEIRLIERGAQDAGIAVILPLADEA